MDAVKGLFQIYEINVYLSVPLDTLLNDISESVNVVYAPYSWSKACLLFPLDGLMASLGTERSVTPLQFVHYVLSPCTSLQIWFWHSRFYGIGHITSLLQNGCQFSTLLL